MGRVLGQQINMSRYNRTPIFNLQLVVHQTGLTPDTLRAWEKRYNFPQPDRTAGGHRLYSEYDIETLKWLLARKEEGMSIGRAVALWRQLEAEGRDPLEAGLNRPLQPSTATPIATGRWSGTTSTRSSLTRCRRTG